MNVNELEAKISTLEEKIFQLEERNRELNFKIIQLSLAKVTHPKYAYTNWVLRGDVSEEKKEKLMCLMAVLTLRFKQQSITLKKNLTTIPDDLLYKDTVPTYEECKNFIFKVLEIKTEKKVIELLKCFYNQGKYKELSKYLLDEIGESITLDQDML